MPQCLKWFLGNFNVVASQNYFYGYVMPRLYGTAAKPAVDTLSHLSVTQSMIFMSLHYIYRYISSIYGSIIDPHNNQLPVGLIAKLAGQWTGSNCKGRGSNPPLHLNFSGNTSYCFSIAVHCEDHSPTFLHFLVAKMNSYLWAKDGSNIAIYQFAAHKHSKTAIF